MQKIGCLGLGNVGRKLAGSLLRNGFDLTVRELEKDAAAELLEGRSSYSAYGRTW